MKKSTTLVLCIREIRKQYQVYTLRKIIICFHLYCKCTRILIFYSYHDDSYSQKNTVTEPILISTSYHISQDVSINFRVNILKYTSYINHIK